MVSLRCRDVPWSDNYPALFMSDILKFHTIRLRLMLKMRLLLKFFLYFSLEMTLQQRWFTTLVILHLDISLHIGNTRLKYIMIFSKFQTCVKSYSLTLAIDQSDFEEREFHWLFCKDQHNLSRKLEPWPMSKQLENVFENFNKLLSKENLQHRSQKTMK